jgi:hypothetical protein
VHLVVHHILMLVGLVKSINDLFNFFFSGWGNTDWFIHYLVCSRGPFEMLVIFATK